jgi:hypothetical protein
MGQYFYVLNLDKKEYLHPHKFGDGLKLMEFGCSSMGTMTALALLLRKSTESGGGDYQGDNALVSSWACDRIAIVGDYDDSGLYDIAEKEYKDISSDIYEAFRTEAESRPGKFLRPDVLIEVSKKNGQS